MSKSSSIFRSSDGTQWKWVDNVLWLRVVKQEQWVRARTSYDEVRQLFFLYEDQVPGGNVGTRIDSNT